MIDALFSLPQGSRLHVGCGGKALPGWVNTDARPEFSPSGITIDIVSTPLPPCRFAEIYLGHVLEHVYKNQTLGVLSRLYEALLPGGVLRISVPDLRLILANCVEGHAFGQDPDPPLFGDYRSFAHEWDRHKRSYTQESLTQELLQAGFTGIREWHPREVPEILAVHDWSCYDTISLNLLGHRPM